MAARSRILIEIEARLEGFRDATRGAILQVREMSAAVKENQKAFDAVGTGIGKFLKAMALVGALGNVVQFVGGLTASLVNLLPAALVLPGAILGIGIAIGTFKLATAGFGDALKGDADAMAKLAPSARQTVQAVQSLKPAFDNLRKSVQQEFFKGFADDVKSLGAIYLPILQKGLPKIADAFNAMGRSAVRVLTDIPARMDFREVLDNTTTALGNMRDTIGNVISGFLGLAGVGSERLPALAAAIDNVAARFRAWVDENVESGAIDDMITRALAGFRLLGDVVTNIGGIIGGVFTGLSQGSGQDFLQVLADSTQAIEDFVNEGETQTALQAIGKAFADVAAVTREIFLTALREVAPIVVELAPVFAQIAQVVGDLLVNALRIVGPLLLGLAKFLNDNKQAIADLAPLVIGLWAAFKGATILTAVAANLGPIVTRLGGMSAILKGGLIIAVGAFAIKLNEMNEAAAAKEGRPLNEVEDDLSNLVGAFQQVSTLDFAGIFRDIGDEWDIVVQKFQTGESPIGAFWKDLIAFIDKTGESFATIGRSISDFVTTTGQSFATIGTAIADGFNTAVTAVRDFFLVTIPNVVSTGLSAVGTAVSTAFTTVVDTVTTVFTDIGTAMSTGASTAVAGAVAFFSQTPAQIGFAIGAAIGDVISWGINLATAFGTAALNAGTQFITGVQTFLSDSVTFVAALPGRIGDALASLAATLQAKAVEAGTAFLTWLGNLFTDTTTRAQQVGPDIGNAVADTATTLRDRAIAAGTEFLTSISNKFTETVTYVNGVPARVGAAIAEVVPILLQKAQQAGQSFIDGVTTKFNEAITYVNGIPGRISAAIGNLGNLLVNAGRSVIDGLLNGIKSGYQAMISFVDGIAAGIAAHKGPISHDKTVLIPAGLALMDGLLQGMRSGSADVLAFTDTIAGAVAATTSAAAAGAATSSAPASRTSSAVDNLLAAVKSGLAPDVRVFIGDRELVDIVRTEVDTADADSARDSRAGGGASF